VRCTNAAHCARFTYHAITRRTVAEIQEKIIEKGGRNLFSRLVHAKDDKDTIASWRSDLNRILHIFNVRSAVSAWLSLTVHFQTELAIDTNANVSDVRHDVTNTRTVVVNTHAVVENTHTAVANTHAVISNTNTVVANTHTLVSDIHRNLLQGQEETDGQQRSVSATPIHRQQKRNTYHPLDSSQVSNLEFHRVYILTPTSSTPPGELPPPPPRACFGRNELIDKIVGLAENLSPIALIGAGGIGKTSVALAVLHDNRIKQRFGGNRRFIRCDQFPASRANFLSRLSKVIGAGVDNPEDLTPLHPFLSSKEMVIVLDNAESVLDPQGIGAREIYAVVEELSRLETICLCITSRISTIPPDCETLNVPTLSMASARDTFYRIYKNNEQPDLVDRILGQLEFHPLSITLLATVAHHSKWDCNRLAQEWDTRRTQVLRTDYNESLSATIELSLASPMFCELGPDARDLLGVVAFFPQGVNENNLDWFFPTISNRRNIFDKFCILSLTYRSDNFTTMLAPLRDYLRPKDPTSSPLLHATKECYLSRLSVYLNPGEPGFDEAQWITSEDVNVEHLLDVFTSIDNNSDIWDACAYFMGHLYWHKQRLVVLGPKLEGLPDNHPSKPKCLSLLARLFDSVGNHLEYNRLLVHTLKLWRERRYDLRVAETLWALSYTSLRLFLREEGLLQAKESLEIFERLNNAPGQARALRCLALLLEDDEQLDAAEEAASRSINLISDRSQFGVCQGYRILGDICCSKGEIEKAIKHFETALEIASSFNWHSEQLWTLYSLALVFLDQGRFDDAHAHVERAKSHAVNAYNLGRMMRLQADIWYKQGRLEEAKSEILSTVDVFQKLGAAGDLESCGRFLQLIEKEMRKRVASGELETVLPPTPIGSPSSARGIE
jgi:tetratricopeptide (TPR) repeat protein